MYDNSININKTPSVQVQRSGIEYNQVPHLTQDTNGKVTNSQQTPQTRAKRSALSQQVTTKHIQTTAHKDIGNIRQNKNINDPQKKYRLGTVSKYFTGGLKPV